MLSEWEKFRGWKVLEFFLKHPDTRIHLKGLSRKLKISPMTAGMYLGAYQKDKILEKEKIANADFYRLNNLHPLAKSLKRAYIISIICKYLPAGDSISSVALFGSCAEGSYDEKSDADILIIVAAEQKIDATKLMNASPLEVNMAVFTIPKWIEAKKRKTHFSEGVLGNHVILYGNEL